MKIVKISFRNLNRQKRRNVLLGVAVGFVFFISTFIVGMATGMLQSLEYNIASAVGGNIWIASAVKSPDTPENKIETYGMMYDEQKKLFDEIVNECNVDFKTISLRTPIQGRLTFAGKKYSTQIWGIKEDEMLAWDGIVYKEGNRENMRKENAILLSQSITDELNLKLHDIISFETKNDKGQNTLVDFQLEGIAVDTNMLSSGFTVFANIDYIHKIYGIDPNASDAFGSYFILLKDRRDQERAANDIENALRKRGLLVTDRKLAYEKEPLMPLQHLLDQLGRGKWDGYKYSVASILDTSPQMSSFANLVQTIALAILVVLLVLTMIGVANTFRMIVFERRGEIGTMRACGASAKSVKNMFLMEGILLTIIAAAVGLIVGILVMFVISLFPVSSTSFFSAFSHGGHMAWHLDSVAIILWFIVLTVLTLISVGKPASVAAKMLPAEALRANK